jgi:hypothetical protein
MLTAEAVIQTEHPDRYLARLCKHASQMAGTFTSAPPRWRAGSPEVRHAECSGSHGTVRLNWGQWTMQAAPGRLMLRAEAADEASLLRIKELLSTRLEKFGSRENLTVSWQPAGELLPPPAGQANPPRAATT